MDVMRIGLWIASAVAVLGAWSSWQAGFPPELAVVRGVIAFTVVSFVAYGVALVVVTAPPPAERRLRDVARSNGRARTAGGTQRAGAGTTEAAAAVGAPEQVSVVEPPARGGGAPAPEAPVAVGAPGAALAEAEHTPARAA